MIASSPVEFVDAVRSHSLGHVALDRISVERIRAALPDGGLVMVGEPHGTHETPGVLHALMTALDVRTIGFEWSHEEMDECVRSFLRTGSFDLEGLWSLPASAELFCGDGRITAGHFALLRRLRGEERLDRAILFDRLDPEPAPEDWRSRDREMAERLLQEWDGRGVAVIAVGGFHVHLEQPGTMAHELAHRVPVCTATIDYAGGHGWSRGAAYEIRGTVPSAAIGLRLPAASPAVVPGKN